MPTGFARGLILGLMIGLICTAAVSSWAAMGKSHWEKRNWHFQAGYLAGFLDLMRIVQSRNPDTVLAGEYKIPPNVMLDAWLTRVNALYAEEDHAQRPLTQIIVLAGEELAAETGYNDTGGRTDGLEAYRRYMILREQREAEARAKAKAEQQPVDAADAKPGTDDGASE